MKQTKQLEYPIPHHTPETALPASEIPSVGHATPLATAISNDQSKIDAESAAQASPPERDQRRLPNLDQVKGSFTTIVPSPVGAANEGAAMASDHGHAQSAVIPPIGQYDYSPLAVSC